MREVKLTTSFVAPLVRRDKTTIYQWFNTPECQPWLPAKTGIGESRTFTPEQAVLLMILSDLNRWGVPVPFAGKIVSLIAERLAAEPSAAEVHLQFHENGATFTEAHGQQPCVLTGVENIFWVKEMQNLRTTTTTPQARLAPECFSCVWLLFSLRKMIPPVSKGLDAV